MRVFLQEGSEREEEEEEENTDDLTDSNKENETDEENNVSVCVCVCSGPFYKEAVQHGLSLRKMEQKHESTDYIKT